MLLSGALFALFATGFWLYCLTDAILTPASQCRGLRKPAWIAVITVTFIGGAIAWLILRQGPDAAWPNRPPVLPLPPLPSLDSDGSDDDDRFLTGHWTDADDAVARHPAGRARVSDAPQSAPKGPDDDLDFLRALDRAIRGNSLARLPRS
jgi:hypothetical protein